MSRFVALNTEYLLISGNLRWNFLFYFLTLLISQLVVNWVTGLVETIPICLFTDMDISLPDEILCHGGSILLSGEESGHSGENREEGAGLQPHHGSFR